MNSRFEGALRASLKIRMSILGVIVTSLFVALFARLFYLQVLNERQLAAAARDNQVRTVYEDAPRGRILDRSGQLLAGNKETDAITVDRDAVTKYPDLLPKLAVFLGADVNTLEERMNSAAVSPYRPVPVATGVDKGLIAAFKERQTEFRGASAATQIERWYPNGTLAAHILGYTGEANKKELDAHDKDGYLLGDEIGKSGIESAYEKDLRGTAGIDKIEVNSSGQPVRVLSHQDAVPGKDVVLTIDANVQRTAESALSDGLAKARSALVRNANAPASVGSVVAVDPQNGGIIALASNPTFDPNAFSKGISNAEYQALTDPQSGLPLNDRAVQGTYAPGSTFKLVTATAALRSGLINANTTINDTGTFTLGRQRFRNAQGAVYGTINLQSAMTVSSDVFFYTLGSRFWDQRRTLGDAMQDTAHDFGFGSTEGIALSGEATGRVPDPAGRKKLHNEYPEAYPEGNWYAGDNVNLAIGQGDTLVTPLQLANSYAAFGNGGNLYRPQLVSRVVDGAGKITNALQPKVVNKVDLPPNVRDPIQNGLMGAVANPRGTANSAFRGFDNASFPVAGKTGTAQVNGKNDTALFAGYGPVGNPRVAISVVMEESGFGGVAAAPVARQVAAQIAGQSVANVELGTGQD